MTDKHVLILMDSGRDSIFLKRNAFHILHRVFSGSAFLTLILTGRLRIFYRPASHRDLSFKDICRIRLHTSCLRLRIRRFFFICIGNIYFLFRLICLGHSLSIHNAHIATGNSTEIRSSREIGRSKIHALNALLFPESAFFLLTFLVELFSSAVVFLCIPICLSTSALNSGHEGFFRDAHQ